jgi:RimJ/RimL family protein N-acetyltransferase
MGTHGDSSSGPVATLPEVQLLPVNENDLPLYDLMFTDPVHMAELGGPQPTTKIPAILEKQINFSKEGKGWVFKIFVESIQQSVGTVMIWRGSYKECDVIEMGWGVHHSFGNRGYGTAALRLILQMAEDTKYWGSGVTLHAFTTVTNGASNRMCQKIEGFYVKEQCEVDYDDRMLTCNHWCIDIV